MFGCGGKTELTIHSFDFRMRLDTAFADTGF